MNLNKTYHNPITFVLVMAWMLSTGSATLAQDKNRKPAGSKIHLQITQEVDGKKVHIDTTYDASQQEAVMAYLRSIGINMSELPPPPPPSLPRSPMPPPAPPAPGMPLPPAPPDEPDSRTRERTYHYYYNDNGTKEEKEVIERAMKEIQIELNNIHIPEIPDFSDMHELHEFINKDICISIDGDMLSEKDKEQFKKEMEKLKKEMKQLNEKLKDLKIEIREKSDDKNDPGNKEKEEGYRNNGDDLNYTYSYSRSPDNAKDGHRPASFHISPNPGNGIIRLNLQLEENEPVDISITDTNGKVVYEEHLENFNGAYEKEIDISDKGKGIYLLTISQGENRMHSKLVVK